MRRSLPILLLSGCAYISMSDHNARKADLEGDTGTESTEELPFNLEIASIAPPGMSDCADQVITWEATVDGVWAGKTLQAVYRFDGLDWIDLEDVLVDDAFGENASIGGSFTVSQSTFPDCVDEPCSHSLELGVSYEGSDESAPAPTFTVVPLIAPEIVDGGLVAADAKFYDLSTVQSLLGDNPPQSLNTSEYPVVGLAISHPLVAVPGALDFKLVACPVGVDPRVIDTDCVEQDGNANPIAGLAEEADVIMGFDTAEFGAQACDALDTLWNLWLEVVGDPCDPEQFYDLNTPDLRFVHDDCDDDGWTIVNGDCADGDAATNPDEPEICDGVDNNCNVDIDEIFDTDADGVTTCGGDCDDDDPSIYPGAFEQCDGVDNDCDPTNEEIGPATVGSTNYGTIQDALTAVVAPDVVLICAGTHYVDLSSNGDVVVRGVDRSTTVINGSASGPVWTHWSGDLTVSNLRITAGASAVNGGGFDCGGMDNTDELTLFDVTVEASSATNNGGGIFAPNVALYNSTISGNGAINGGGIYAVNAVTMDYTSTVTGNQATSYGGGIHAISIQGDGIVEGNDGTWGGGIAGIDLTINGGLRIQSNSAQYSGQGGGIHCDPCDDLDLDGLFLSDNTSDAYGGGIYIGNSTNVAIDATVFNNNSAAVDGGGMLLVSGGDAAVLTTVTFGENDAGNMGGAILADVHDLTLVDSFVDFNIAGGDGGGIFFTGNAATLSIANTDFNGNEAILSGGALTTGDGTTNSISLSAFDSNIASQAGAIRANGTLTISDTDFTSNESLTGKAGAISVEAMGVPEITTITGGTMLGNFSGDGGGAMWIDGTAGQTFLTGVHFDENEALGVGGAISITDADVELDTVLFTNNDSHLAGGAVAVGGSSAFMRADDTDWSLIDDNTPNDIACAQGPGYQFGMVYELCCTEMACTQTCP